MVDDVLVNTEVDGLIPPMAVLLIVPPVIVTLGDTRLAMLLLIALSVVPEAVAKPNQEVEVPLVKERAVIVPLEELNVPIVPLVE